MPLSPDLNTSSPYSAHTVTRLLQRFSDYIRDKSLQLFRYRVILLGVIFFATPIWALDQGQDLLVNSNSTNRGVIFFMTVVLVAAFLNWYLAKLFFEKKYCRPVFPFIEPVLADPVQLTAEKKVSRMLGICTIILPATAILHALQVIQVHYMLDAVPAYVWLLLLLAVYFVLVKFSVAELCCTWCTGKWGNKKTQRLLAGLLIILTLLVPVTIWLLLLGNNSNTPASLIYLFWHLVCLSFSFYLFVSLRNFLFPGSGWLGSRIGWPVILSSSLLALIFVLLNLFPLSILSLDCNFLSLPLLLSGLLFYILLFTLLIRLSLWKKINFILFIFVAGLVISMTAKNDYHAVAQEDVRKGVQEVSLNTYFKQWLLQRKDEILNGGDSFPVFLVNSYGGGIRAAAYTNMVFSWLDSTMIRSGHHKKGFEHYVFSVSGASGGTIGAAVQCAYRAQHLDDSANAYALDSFIQFYQHDFLTPLLINMLGRDVWASSSSLRLWKDRSAVQEDLWAGFAKRSLHVSLADEFNSLWDTSSSNKARYEVPLLFSNTLNVDDGLKGIMSPVALNPSDFPAVISIRQRIDSMNALRKNAPPQSLSLMTGAFLSARFPFISPSGKMGAGYHFMDGGAKDNSGASTSEDIFVALAKEGCRSMTDGQDTMFCRLLKKVKFYFVSLTNSPYYDPDTRKLVSNRFEPISPIVGLINSGINGNAQAADYTLQFRYSTDSLQFRGIRSDYSCVWVTATSIPDSKGELYSPVLPLGWQISAPSLERMRHSFDGDLIRVYNAQGIRKILKIMADW